MKKIIKAIISFFEIVGEEMTNRNEALAEETDRTAGLPFLL